ncbi:GIY-YIG nuclease family protein [Adlercreutzia agrestimuris]|uniref:GIY-YIG nuclease family protein n=1 Tax=Adlercreutzia agrestimuris TaxID=2941324 RepID=UPI00203DE84F|nr:GIY-YIG nuclease family protein [Adlercreutzia agrestimuris]
MTTEKRKQLKDAYRDRHPEMGVLYFRCTPTGETFLMCATDIPAKFNRLRFQLADGLCPNKHLQQLWKEHGEAAFETGTAKALKYDDPSADYSEDLELLMELCLLDDPTAQRLWK